MCSCTASCETASVMIRANTSAVLHTSSIWLHFKTRKNNSKTLSNLKCGVRHRISWKDTVSGLLFSNERDKNKFFLISWEKKYRSYSFSFSKFSTYNLTVFLLSLNPFIICNDLTSKCRLVSGLFVFIPWIAEAGYLCWVTEVMRYFFLLPDIGLKLV